jgi:hypothetical protein
VQESYTGGFLAEMLPASGAREAKPPARRPSPRRRAAAGAR